MEERKCLNKACSYHEKGKCTLFPGGAWLTCKRSGVQKKPNLQLKKKGN
jgi:hypothetical protein